MSVKPIIPCPQKFLAAGIERMTWAAVLVQIGRCGLQGCPVETIAASTLMRGKRLSISTVSFVVAELHKAGWITRVSRSNGRGRAYWWIVTVKGWELLTQEPDTAMFPDALKPMVK